MENTQKTTATNYLSLIKKIIKSKNGSIIQKLCLLLRDKKIWKNLEPSYKKTLSKMSEEEIKKGIENLSYMNISRQPLWMSKEPLVIEARRRERGKEKNNLIGWIKKIWSRPYL